MPKSRKPRGQLSKRNKCSAIAKKVWAKRKAECEIDQARESPASTSRQNSQSEILSSRPSDGPVSRNLSDGDGEDEDTDLTITHTQLNSDEILVMIEADEDITVSSDMDHPSVFSTSGPSESAPLPSLASECDVMTALIEHFPDTTPPDLEVVTDTELIRPEDIAPGRRIVNLVHFSKECFALQRHCTDHIKQCTGSKIVLTNERLCGMMSYLDYDCTVCGVRKTITTEAESKKEEINDALVWGAISVGVGHHQTQEMMALMEVPVMGKKKWDKHEDRIHTVWEKQLDKDMRANGERELSIAVQKGHIEDGIPYITVIVDGGWSKRSYKHDYKASSGVSCIIGAETKGLLYMGVCNKYCYICATAKPDTTPKKHKCYKNFSGPSTSMEQSVLVQGFRASEEMHGLRYKYMVGDGDSSVFARIQRGVRYGKSVVKLECANHIVRGYTDKLHTLRADTSHPLPARKLLTQLIPRLTKAARGAITSSGLTAARDVEILRQDLRNSPHHVFSDHARCRELVTDGETGKREGFCTRKNVSEENKVPFMQQSSVWAGILKALEPIVTKADRLTRNVTTNQAERFMGLVATFTGGKRVDHTKRGGYQTRCLAAGLSHIGGPSWHRSPMKKLFGHSPGAVSKKVLRTRNHVLETNKIRAATKRSLGLPYVSRRKKKSTSAGPDADYGPQAAEPDISVEAMHAGKQQVLRKLELVAATAESRHELEQRTIGQAGNPAWGEAKRNMLTASRFGKVCQRRPYTSCHNLVLEVTNPKDIRSPYLAYGRIHEPKAIEYYEERFGVSVTPCGLFVDSNYPYLGASPDGILGEEKIIEVKTIPSINNLRHDGSPVLKIREAAVVKKDLFVGVHNGELYLKKNKAYYFQIQGQLNITKRQTCDLVLYTDHDREVISIQRDEHFWSNIMVPKLKEFYLECVLPELVDSRDLRGMRVRDSLSIVEEQKRRNSAILEKTRVVEMKKRKRSLKQWNVVASTSEQNDEEDADDPRPI